MRRGSIKCFYSLFYQGNFAFAGFAAALKFRCKRRGSVIPQVWKPLLGRLSQSLCRPLPGTLQRLRRQVARGGFGEKAAVLSKDDPEACEKFLAKQSPISTAAMRAGAIMRGVSIIKPLLKTAAPNRARRRLCRQAPGDFCALMERTLNSSTSPGTGQPAASHGFEIFSSLQTGESAIPHRKPILTL